MGLDREDPLAEFRSRFELPDDVIYLDGNSLGPLPKGVAERLDQMLRHQWGESLIRGWNQHGWIDLPERVGNKIAQLTGAVPGTVTCVDTTSLNLVKVLSAALELRPGRRVILSDPGNFPTDLYMAQGLIRVLSQNHEIRLAEPDELESAIFDDTAVVMLTQVDYRSGRVYDMARITDRAHEVGALTIWDLAHSAGALPVDLQGANVDFAIGCSYKYLNGGPGAPAWVYVRPGLNETGWPLLSGWMGHESPFEFDPVYRPANGIGHMRVGTPPVLALAALDAALDVWNGVDMSLLRTKSSALGDLFIEEVERQCLGYGLRLASPRNAAERGSQVSFHCDRGYAVMQALIADGVIGDFRSPDILRFGFNALYITYANIVEAARRLKCVLDEEKWNRPEYLQRAKVT